jgi:hypothetical protein
MLSLRTLGTAGTGTLEASSYIKTDIKNTITPKEFTISMFIKLNEWGK